MTRSTNTSRGKSGVVKKNQSKKKISHSDIKRNKVQVEKINNEGLLPAEVFKLSSRGESKRDKICSAGALQAKTLQNDQRKDREVQDKIKAERKQTDKSILKQIRDISGFSL